MFNLFLIIMGLFSNPSSSNTSNCGGDDTTPNIVQPTSTTPTGGEDGHPVPPKIIGG